MTCNFQKFLINTLQISKHSDIFYFIGTNCSVFSFIIFCFFGQSDQKRKKSAVLFVYFLYKKSAFCLKLTADFFVFWSLWPKNKKRKMEWTKHKSIKNKTANGLSLKSSWPKLLTQALPIWWLCWWCANKKTSNVPPGWLLL